jgi:hypothetical protein
MTNATARALVALLMVLTAMPASAQQIPDSEQITEIQPPLAPPPAVAPVVLAPAAPPLVLQRLPRYLRPQPASDPARTRLQLTSTAEVLRQGEIEFTSRGLLSAEIAVGATNWLQLELRTTPLLMVIPGVGAEGSFWAGGLRLRLLKTSWVTFTAEAEGMSVLGWAGFRAGGALRIGNDRFALHAAGSGMKLWNDDQTMNGLVASGGMDVRVHPKVKLVLEGLYHRNSEMDLLMVTPGVRLHGHHFAIDFGLGLTYTKVVDTLLPLPMINLSVNY